MNTMQKIHEIVGKSEPKKATKKETPKKESDSFQYALLPPVSKLKLKGAKERAIALLEELDSVSLMEDAAKERADEIKQELEKIQSEAGVEGLKHEHLCFVARQMPGRSTLDKTLLIENRVTAETIQQSMKSGKPYTERRFKNLNL